MENLTLNGTVFDCQATDELVAGIQGATEDYNLDINSPGGDVFAGLTIVNAIQNNEHKATANVHVMAASIAAIIALACDEVVVDGNSVIMLHNCWTVADGNKEELQNAVEAMKRIDAIQRNILGTHCRDIDKVSAAMDAGDFWMTADEAAEYFDNVVVKKVERPEGSLAAVGSLYDLVIKARTTNRKGAAMMKPRNLMKVSRKTLNRMTTRTTKRNRIRIPARMIKSRRRTLSHPP